MLIIEDPFWCLKPLSTIFQLYPEKTTYMWQITEQVYEMIRIHNNHTIMTTTTVPLTYKEKCNTFTHNYYHFIFPYDYKHDIYTKLYSVRGVVVLTLYNISVISWRSVLLVEEPEDPEKITDLSQVTDKLYHIMLYIMMCVLEKSIIINIDTVTLL
jgi:hypothetical protein